MGGQDKWPAPPTGSRQAVLGDVAHLIDKIHQDLSGRQFIIDKIHQDLSGRQFISSFINFVSFPHDCFSMKLIMKVCRHKLTCQKCLPGSFSFI